MIPQQLKDMFGLTDQKDLSMANNIWKMLDQMSESDPEQYKQFVQKNVSQGLNDAKHKQEEKDKPYKVVPKPGFCLTMTATLNQQPLESSINQKMLVTSKPWDEVKKKFNHSIKITFNITHSDRIKDLHSKSTKKPIQKFIVSQLKDVQMFFYSLQGPHIAGNNYDYCMIVGSKLFQDLVSQNNGKRILMGLCVSYLQERLGGDKNPLLKVYNPEQYQRLAYYNIQKHSMAISDKRYCFGDQKQPGQFLLERQIDKKREEEQKQKEKEKKKESSDVKPKKPEIIFKEQPKKEEPLPEIKLTSEPAQSKKPLIQVLKEEQTKPEIEQISYTMKQSQTCYNFEFLLPGVTSIKEVDLEMKPDCVKVKTNSLKELTINLKRSINEETIKAKFKKGEHMLRVQAKFI